MKKIGILFGQEDTFPWAFIERVNSKRVSGITAEPVKVEKLIQGEPTDYAVIIDRISQDVPFYRAFLKNAALNGTAVINNPFWWSADEKFFNNCLALKLGVAVPKTVLLPSNQPSAGDRPEVVPQPRLSARLAGDLRLRRLPGLLQAIRRRRLEERLPADQRRGVLPGLR
jgi:Glutathione synthase/Ribosomal protein S6 modification enzyme (glutaminyl transferase)